VCVRLGRKIKCSLQDWLVVCMLRGTDWEWDRDWCSSRRQRGLEKVCVAILLLRP
jgi:hypothetical protein